MKKYTKKYALVFIVIVFALTMILWPLATKQSIHSTQEDPGTAESGFRVSLDYGDIKDIVGNTDNYDELIQKLDINRDDVPPDYLFIYDTYKDLIKDINDKLGILDGKDAGSDEDVVSDEDIVSEEDVGLLDKAKAYLGEGKVYEAGQILTDADLQVETIEDLLADVDEANELIIEILGSLAPKDQRKEAKDLKDRLEEDKNDLNELWANVPQNTYLDIDVRGPIYPGRPYTIHGEITYDGETPTIERDITLLWDDEPLNTADSYQAQSSFDIEVTPDVDTMLGEHKLKVTIEAQDTYTSTSEATYITVTTDLPEIRIEDLSYKLLSRKVEIKGKLNSDTPLHNATVFIELKGTSTKVTLSPEGEPGVFVYNFEASLDLPLGLFNLGPKEIKLRFEPSDPWQSPTEITSEIFILDIFSLGFISTAFIAVGMVVFVTRKGRPGKGGSGILEMSPSPEPDLEFTSTPLQEFKEEVLKGTRGQIAKAYIESMKRVENATGVSMKPYMTLREFLEETRPKLNGAAESFKELTRLAEDALYCPHIPGSDDADIAERLSLTVKESLKS